MIERKVYKPEEKLKIVLEGLSGTIQVSDLCRKHGIDPKRFYAWKQKLVNSSDIFDDRGRKNTSQEREIEELRNENAILKNTIAEITTENLQLKKKTGNYGSGRVRT